MPNNAEYVIAAYGIVITVVALYAVGIRMKLISVKNRLANIAQGKQDAEKKP